MTDSMRDANQFLDSELRCVDLWLKVSRLTLKSALVTPRCVTRGGTNILSQFLLQVTGKSR